MAGVYSTLITNLSAYWTMEESSGTRLDSHHSNNLTDNNTVTQKAGIIGNAGEFKSASSEYLSVSDNADLSAGDIDFSAAFHVYFDSTTAAMTLFAKGTADTVAGLEYRLNYETSSSRFVWLVSNGTTSKSVTANAYGSAPSATWIHVYVWHDSVGDLIGIRINDTSQNTTADSGGSQDTTGEFRIGRSAAGGSYHNGRIDAFGFWRRILSSQEITAHYNGGSGLDYPFINYYLRVKTDWGKIPDISSYIKSYSITRGRSSELDRYGSGAATLIVDNASGVFTPLNTTGCLTGSLIPGRVIQVQWIVDGITNGSTIKRFTGKTISFSPEPTIGKGRQATIICSDDFEGFQRRETRSSLYTDIKSGCLIGNILDSAEFPSASRSINTGQDTYEFAHFDRRKIDEVLVDINQTEYGTIFIRGDGYFVFHDRYYRSRTTTVSASFNETMSELSFLRDANDLRTEARVTVLPKQKKGQATIWSIQDPIILNASTAGSFFGNYIDPTTCALSLATGVASPAIGVDALLNSNPSGTGTNLTTNLSACLTAFAESFKVVASNGGSITGYITKFNVIGCPIVTYEQMSRSYINATACALYGVRTLPYDAPLLSNAEKGQNLAIFLATRYSDPANVDKTSITIPNSDSTNWNQILLRELDDRIAVTASEVGLSGADFFIGYLREDWSSDTRLHSVNWTLEKQGIDDGFFLVDVHVVGGSKLLGY